MGAAEWLLVERAGAVVRCDLGIAARRGRRPAEKAGGQSAP
ncbi:hypothetical protein [Micromonospora sp. WMMD1155]|nr:hypothetical protein [Micromonospora sp. WMMD1155]WFE51218.1 hypothetical protein O7617_13175 [Micromonospora sp. WMMD1155]